MNGARVAAKGSSGGGFPVRARRGEIGLPKIPLHGLRHTWATIALSQNVHSKVVSERLGHSTISMTLDTYSDVLPGLQEEAATTVDALIVG